jgi:hypothetical protein
MGGRTVYRTLSPKRHLFKLGLTEGSQEREESATHILYDREAIAYLRLSHLGQSFMEPNDYYDTRIYKVLQFIQNVRLIKG